MANACRLMLSGVVMRVSSMRQKVNPRKRRRTVSQYKRRMHYAEIIKAIEHDRVDLLQAQISTGFDLETVDEHLNTPMHYACLHDRIDIIRCLHRNGASLEARNRFGFTPFLLAVRHGHEKLVRALIEEFGVDYRDDFSNAAKRTYFGLTAMELASLQGYSSICAYLILCGHKQIGDLSCEGHIKLQRRPARLSFRRKR